MSTRAGLAIVTTIAVLITIAMAWPVVVAPAQMIFGHEIAGRHHDAYTVIFQIATSGAVGPYAQPLTDRLGWLLARLVNPVAAYNLLVLATFPFATATTYALARYLRIPHAGAALAALAFAFSPFHLAHAAYHPHIAQTQWLPLFLLALFALVDRPSWLRALALVAATAALGLSNDYAGLIGAVVAPVALAAYWAVSPHAGHNWRRLAIPAGVLASIAAAGVAFVAVVVPQVFAQARSLAFPVVDVAIYSARWWSYFLPAVDHPVLGGVARDALSRGGVTDAIVEQQIYLGAALLTLALVALVVAVRRWRAEPDRRVVIALGVIALVAAFVSVGPMSGDCVSAGWTPACRLYSVVPMFRSYARFAVVTVLALSIAAGAGFSWLTGRARRARLAGWALVAVAAFEFWPWPWRAHDVLPTQAHRWLATQPASQRTLDCVQPSQSEFTVSWLMQRSVDVLGPAFPFCDGPDLGGKLAALRYTHVIARSSAPVFAVAREVPAGLTLVNEFPDSRVFFVTAPVPPIVTMLAAGFYADEHAGGDWWRWMPAAGQWTIRNTTGAALHATIATGLESAGGPRILAVTLDGVPTGDVSVRGELDRYTLGPWTIPPGDHILAFTASGAPIRPSDVGRSTDDRLLSVSFRNPRWIVQ